MSNYPQRKGSISSMVDLDNIDPSLNRNPADSPVPNPINNNHNINNNNNNTSIATGGGATALAGAATTKSVIPSKDVNIKIKSNTEKPHSTSLDEKKQQRQNRERKRREQQNEEDEENEEEEEVEELPEVELTPLEKFNQPIYRTRMAYAWMVLGHFAQIILIGATAKVIEPTPSFLTGILVASTSVLAVELCFVYFRHLQFSLWNQEEFGNAPEVKKRDVISACKQLRLVPIVVFMLNLFAMLMILYIIANAFNQAFNQGLKSCPEIPSDSFSDLSMNGQALFVLYILALIFHGFGACGVGYLNHELSNSMKALKRKEN